MKTNDKIEALKKEDQLALGRRIKEAYKYANLTQIELSERLEVSQNIISRWCKATRNPKKETLEEIASICKTDFVWLSKGKDLPILLENATFQERLDFVVDLKSCDSDFAIDELRGWTSSIINNLSTIHILELAMTFKLSPRWFLYGDNSEFDHDGWQQDIKDKIKEEAKKYKWEIDPGLLEKNKHLTILDIQKIGKGKYSFQEDYITTCDPNFWLNIAETMNSPVDEGYLGNFCKVYRTAYTPRDNKAFTRQPPERPDFEPPESTNNRLTLRRVPMYDIISSVCFDIDRMASVETFFVDIDDKKAFACKITENTMSPTYIPGDIVVFSPSRSHAPNDDVLYRLKDGKSGFSQLHFDNGYCIFRSINKDTKELKVLIDQVDKIIVAYSVTRLLGGPNPSAKDCVPPDKTETEIEEPKEQSGTTVNEKTNNQSSIPSDDVDH